MKNAKVLIILLAMFAVAACEPKNPAPATKDGDTAEKTEAPKEEAKTADAGAAEKKADAGAAEAPKEKEKGKEKADEKEKGKADEKAKEK